MQSDLVWQYIIFFQDTIKIRSNKNFRSTPDQDHQDYYSFENNKTVLTPHKRFTAEQRSLKIELYWVVLRNTVQCRDSRSVLLWKFRRRKIEIVDWLKWLLLPPKSRHRSSDSVCFSLSFIPSGGRWERGELDGNQPIKSSGKYTVALWKISIGNQVDRYWVFIMTCKTRPLL